MHYPCVLYFVEQHSIMLYFRALYSTVLYCAALSLFTDCCLCVCVFVYVCVHTNFFVLLVVSCYYLCFLFISFLNYSNYYGAGILSASCPFCVIYSAIFSTDVCFWHCIMTSLQWTLFYYPILH